MLINKDTSVLLIIDVQENLTPVQESPRAVISGCSTLLEVAGELNIPKVTKFKQPSVLVYTGDGRTGDEFAVTGNDPANNGCLYLHPDQVIPPVEASQPNHFSYWMRHNSNTGINLSFLDGHAQTVASGTFLLWKNNTTLRTQHFSGL